MTGSTLSREEMASIQPHDTENVARVLDEETSKAIHAEMNISSREVSKSTQRLPVVYLGGYNSGE